MGGGGMEHDSKGCVLFFFFTLLHHSQATQWGLCGIVIITLPGARGHCSSIEA